MVARSESVLKESCDVVGDTLEFLVAFCLGCFESPRHMSPDKRHRHGVRSRAMMSAAAAIVLERGRYWGYGSFWGEYEWAGRLAALRLAGIDHDQLRDSRLHG